MSTLERMLKIQKEFQNRFPVETLRYADISSAIASEAMEVWHDTDGRWWKEEPEYYCRKCDKLLTRKDVYIYPQDDFNKDTYCLRCNAALLEGTGLITIKEHLIEESADILHFLLIFWLKLGLTEEEIFNAYLDKMGVNIDRQEKGY